MIPIARPQIGEEEVEAVLGVLKSGVIAQGPKVSEFERAFAEYVGTEYAVAVNSGTAALHVALSANGVGQGDEVITTPFSFIATGNSILFCGAKPVFVDIREDTYNIDEEKIGEAVTSKTKAIMPVHLYGQPAEMKVIGDLAEDHGFCVIEDACQAHGAEYHGSKVGSFGEGCFSFYPTKNMTTGEGGMITTDDKDVMEKARMIINHGSKQRYYHEILGYNYRMTDVAAAIGVEQLKKLDKFNQKRIQNAGYLTKNLKKIMGIITPKTFDNIKHVFHQYTIKVTDEFPTSRDELTKKLEENKIGYGIYYPLPIHKQTLYKNLGYDDSLPVSEKLSQEVISLPVHPSIGQNELDCITNFFAKLKGKC